MPESLKNLSKILVGRVESWNERQNPLNGFSLFFKAVLRDKNLVRLRSFRRGPEGSLVLYGELQNFFFFHSKDC